jgi:hypothetical protein
MQHPARRLDPISALAVSSVVVVVVSVVEAVAS